MASRDEDFSLSGMLYLLLCDTFNIGRAAKNLSGHLPQPRHCTNGS